MLLAYLHGARRYGLGVDQKLACWIACPASRARSGEAGKIESSLLILAGVGGLVCGHGWSGGYSCSLGEVVDRGLVDAGGFAQGR